MWDASDGKLLRTLAGHRGLVSMLAFAPDGSRLVTGGADGAARVWDVTTAGPGLVLGDQTYYSPFTAVGFAPDGDSLFTTGWWGGWIWDLVSTQRSRAMHAAWGPGASAADGSYVIAASGRRGAPGAGSWGWASGERTGFVETPREVKSVSISEAGVAALGLECCGAPAVLLWDPARPDVEPTAFGRTTGATRATVGVSLSRDGSAVAAIDAFGTLRVWDAASRELTYKVRAQSGLGTGVAYGPDAATIATTGAEGMTLLDARDGHLISSLGGVGALRSPAFSGDRRFIAAGGEDNRTTVWEAATGRLVRSLGGSDSAPITGVAFSADGSLLAATDDEGLLKTYALGVDRLEAIGGAQITRSLTDAECAQYLHEAPCPAGLAAPAGTPTAPPAVALEGAFTSDVSAADLSAAGLGGRATSYRRGQWTLALAGGTYVWHHDHPTFGAWETAGTYTVDGDRLILIDGADPACFGASMSVRWRRRGAELLLHEPDLRPPCATMDQLASVAAAKPWRAVGHIASGG